jgi:hypothetical protein
VQEIVSWLERFGPDLIPAALTLALLVGAAVTASILRPLLQSWLGKFELRSRLSYESVLTITRIATAALWLVVITVVLEIWGVGLGGIWAVVASVATGIGVGFLATWTMVSNVTASFFITIWRPFQLGDTVEVLPENLKGRVIDSNLMFVALRDDGGAIIQIPNNLFFQKMFRVVSGGNRPPLEPSGTRAAFARPGQSAEARATANVSAVGLPDLGLFEGGDDLDKTQNATARERLAAIHKGFVIADPGIGFCQLLAGRPHPDDLRDDELVDRPKRRHDIGPGYQ